MGVHGAQKLLVKAFSIDVFVTLRDDSIICPLGGFEGETNIEFRADGLDGNGLVSNWQFFPYSSLSWARLNCYFGVDNVEIGGNEDQGMRQ